MYQAFVLESLLIEKKQIIIIFRFHGDLIKLQRLSEGFKFVREKNTIYIFLRSPIDLLKAE